MSLTLFTLQYACSLYCSLYISQRACKETLFKNQELLYLVIISFIHVTLMFYPGIILLGKIRSLSLLGLKGSQKMIKKSYLSEKLCRMI